MTLGHWAQSIVICVLFHFKALKGAVFTEPHGNCRVRLFFIGLDVLMVSGFPDDRQAIVNKYTYFSGICWTSPFSTDLKLVMCNKKGLAYVNVSKK